MDTVKLIALGDLQLGLIVFVMSLPLVLRKVPRNKAFGIRIRAAMESDEKWYDINTYGGRQLATWSWLLIAAGAAGFFIPQSQTGFYAYGSLLAATVSIGLPILLIYRWSRKLGS